MNEKKRSVVLGPGRLRLAEYERRDWVANAPEGCKPEDIKNPEFWSIMAGQLKPYDRIEVRSDDGTWIAEVLVKIAERTYAHVTILKVYELDGVDEGDSGDGLDVKFKGPHKKWCVIRKSDQEIIKENLESRDAANEWVGEYLKSAA